MCMNIKSPHLRSTPSPHISTKREQYVSFHLWTVDGEWTLASTDCVKYGNGRDTGARCGGTLEAAHRGLGTEVPPVMSTRPSYASFGNHKSQVGTLIWAP